MEVFPLSLRFFSVFSWCFNLLFVKVRKNNVFSFNLKGHLLRTWDISPEVIRPPQLFPCGLAVKEYAFSAGDLGSIPGLGRSPGEGIGYPLQCSWASLGAQLVKNLPAVWEIFA